MKLTDTQTMTMENVLKECDIIEQKFHTNDDGEIMTIEVKYRPKDAPKSQKAVDVPNFMRNRG